MDIEFRSFGLDGVETREADDHTGHVSAHFSIFGNQDKCGTVFDKGAFKKTIKDNQGKFAITWFHHPDCPIGIGLFEEDDKGLRADTEIDLDAAAGHDVFSGIKRGYVDCCSIGFRRITEVLKDGIVHLKEVKLYEGAFITRGFAANELAKVESIRAATAGVRRIGQALQEGAAEELQAALDDVRSLLGEMGDGLVLPELDFRPYPNEHACRLLDPGQFVRFFRKHVKDTKEVNDYKPTGKPYDLIIGYRKDESSAVQAHRYPKDTWTAEQAKKHCSAHDGKSFEPAKRSEDDDPCHGSVGKEILRQLEEMNALLKGGGPPVGTRPGGEPRETGSGPQTHPDSLEELRQLGRELRETLTRTR